MRIGRNALPLGAALLVTAACGTDLDTTRGARRATSLGEDVYGVLCDRVGASVLAEDLMGDSYRAVCHRSDAGAFADAANTAVLPPSTSQARARSLAALTTLARHRDDLIRALDATFPDVSIDDPSAPGDPARRVRLHDALLDLTKRLVPLYASNPLAALGARSGADALPLVPATTEALGRVFGAVASSKAARDALAQMSGRYGYRPAATALGAMRPALAYPRLRPLAREATRVLGPGGGGATGLQALLDVTERELSTWVADAPLPPFRLVDAARRQPNRPRTDLELLRSFLLVERDEFADGATTGPLLAARDVRGFVVPRGNDPGVVGSVPAPFVDVAPAPDGFADVDALGRFVDASGAPLPLDPPQPMSSIARVRAPDARGRALDDRGEPLYAYIDPSRTFTRALAGDLAALLDGDPADDHETAMDALAGAAVLLGDRVDAKRSAPYTLAYRGFDPATSPLVDLAHATGQLLGDAGSDDTLASLADLARAHASDVARVTGAALATYADATDAAQPMKAAAHLARTSTIWDDMADVLSEISAVGPDVGNPRGLLEDLLAAIGDDRSLKLGPSYSRFMRYRDRITYDPAHVDGPPWNLESSDTSPPHVEVDRASPPSDAPGNRSGFQRFVQLIHDANGVRTCNKAGGVLDAKLGGLSVRWPLIGSFAECELFQIDDMAVFYLQSIVGKAHLDIKSGTLNGLMSFLGAVGGDADALLDQSSGITGMNTHPTARGLDRFVFFGSHSPRYAAMPDLDPLANAGARQTNTFVTDLIDPVPTSVCPQSGPHLTNQCATFDDTFRARDAGTIFLWEHFDFHEAMTPVLEAFVRHGKEHLFVELIEVVHRHWASAAHGPECDPGGTAATNPRYCSEDGAVAYEPIVVDALLSDLLPSLHDLVRTMQSQAIVSVRSDGSTRDGVAIAADLTRQLFDASRAAAAGTKDRAGRTTTTRSDGSPKAQVTPFDLFAGALVGMDARFEGAKGYDAAALAARRAAWKHARSQLVDQLLAVDGSGPGASFRNRALAAALPDVLDRLREQVNARCPDREAGAPCTWATQSVAAQMGDSVGGPTLAAIVDVLDAVRADEPARRELERLASHLLGGTGDADARAATLASLTDLFQSLRDEPDVAPLMAALSTAAAPDDASASGAPTPGLATTTVRALRVLVDDAGAYDRFHALDTVLRALATPMGPDASSPTPLDIFIDTVVDVNRFAPSVADPALSPDDYAAITGTVRDFLTSQTRGLEQFYSVVRGRSEP